MKNLIYISFFLCGCSLMPDVRFMDSRLSPYYHEFLEEGKKRGYDFNTEFLFLEVKDVDGIPAKTFHPTKDRVVIRVDPDYLEEYKNEPLTIEKTIFHELGHGLLNRDHVDYNSIMKQGRVVYNPSNKKEMLDELFQ